MEPLDAVQLQRFRDETRAAASSSRRLTSATTTSIGAAIAHMGLPLNVVADDSAFPELFEYLRAQREQWHATLIPWRNLRAIFGVLRRRELLGLLVDWGYRSDGIPVQLFDAWTDAAGRAGHAGRQDSVADPAGDHDPRARRPAPGDPRSNPIAVPSSDPADLQRATQAIADALAETIRPAPEQWYSFKPIWPATRGRGGRPRTSGARDAGRATRSRARLAICRATRPTRSRPTALGAVP